MPSDRVFSISDPHLHLKTCHPSPNHVPHAQAPAVSFQHATRPRNLQAQLHVTLIAEFFQLLVCIRRAQEWTQPLLHCLSTQHPHCGVQGGQVEGISSHWVILSHGAISSWHHDPVSRRPHSCSAAPSWDGEEGHHAPRSFSSPHPTSAPRGPAHLPTISPAPFGTERPQCFHHVLAGTRQHLQGEPKGGFLLRKPESSPNVTGSLLGENSRDQRNPEACREASTTRCQSSAWRREAAEHLEGRSENARNGAVCRQPGSPGRNTSTGEVQYGRTLIGAPTDLCWEQDRHVPRTPPLPQWNKTFVLLQTHARCSIGKKTFISSAAYHC